MSRQEDIESLVMRNEQGRVQHERDQLTPEAKMFKQVYMRVWTATQQWKICHPDENSTKYLLIFWFSETAATVEFSNARDLPAAIRMKMLTLQMSDDMKTAMRKSDIMIYHLNHFSLAPSDYLSWPEDTKTLIREVGWGPVISRNFPVNEYYCFKLTEDEYKEVMKEVKLYDSRRASQEEDQGCT